MQSQQNQNNLVKEVNWERLDKTKFFVVGTGLFTGVTVMLFPFSVIKTRMQVSIATPGSQQATVSATVREISRNEGFRGFYRGFSTVILGAIPARTVYLSTLELTKSSALQVISGRGFSGTTEAWFASGVGGLCASMATQLVVVPMDVVSSRLMTQGMSDSVSTVRYTGGLDALRTIIRTEGVRGLYRGFSISVLTYAPSSATWWSTYGASQPVFWNLYDLGCGWMGWDSQVTAGGPVVMGIQALGGTCAGIVSALVTTPMDTVKTRIQVLKNEAGESLTLSAVVRDLMGKEGVRGFYRGFGPRCASTALWGTCMVSTYEFLKRLAVKAE